MTSIATSWMPDAIYQPDINSFTYSTTTSFSPLYFAPKMEEKPTDELQINVKKSPIKFNFNL